VERYTSATSGISRPGAGLGKGLRVDALQLALVSVPPCWMTFPVIPVLLPGADPALIPLPEHLGRPALEPGRSGRARRVGSGGARRAARSRPSGAVPVPLAESVRGAPHWGPRRECLGHVVVLTETHLRHLLRDYLTYYHRCRTHLSLEKDTRRRDRWSGPTRVESSRCPWSEACIIGTRDGLRKIPPAGGAYQPRGSRRSAGQRGLPRSSSAWSETPHETRGSTRCPSEPKARCS
jgi:hypothetical protein